MTLKALVELDSVRLGAKYRISDTKCDIYMSTLPNTLSMKIPILNSLPDRVLYLLFNHRLAVTESA
jgi:hypothetical protein